MGGSPPNLPSGRRKGLPRGGGPSRPKYPSDDIDNYKKVRRPDANPKIRVPLECWDEWEELRGLLGEGADTTHAIVFHWLYDETQNMIQELKTWREMEAARLLQKAIPSTTPVGKPSHSNMLDLNADPTNETIDIMAFFGDPFDINEHFEHTEEDEEDDWPEDVREKYVVDEFTLIHNDEEEVVALGVEVSVKAQWEDNKTNLWQEIKVGLKLRGMRFMKKIQV
ncbi:unnamed protein product [Calypogeia fissa]